MNRKNVWPHGAFARIAAEVGVSRAYIRNIASGLTSAGIPLSRRLVLAAAHAGIDTLVSDWAVPMFSKHPLFIRQQGRES